MKLYIDQQPRPEMVWKFPMLVQRRRADSRHSGGVYLALGPDKHNANNFVAIKLVNSDGTLNMSAAKASYHKAYYDHFDGMITLKNFGGSLA